MSSEISAIDAVHRQLLDLAIGHQAEQQAEHADEQAGHQQRAAVHAEELDLPEVGQDQRGLAAGVLGHAAAGPPVARRPPSAGATDSATRATTASHMAGEAGATEPARASCRGMTGKYARS